MTNPEPFSFVGASKREAYIKASRAVLKWLEAHKHTYITLADTTIEYETLEPSLQGYWHSYRCTITLQLEGGA